MTLAILFVSTGLQCVGLAIAVRLRRLSVRRNAWTLLAGLRAGCICCRQSV